MIILDILQFSTLEHTKFNSLDPENTKLKWTFIFGFNMYIYEEHFAFLGKAVFGWASQDTEHSN